MLYDWAPRTWQDEFIEEMQLRAPVYIVAARNQGGSGDGIDALRPIDQIAYGPFPAILDWLEAQYEFEEAKYGYLIFRRRE